ncbi:MAG: ABC transporter ATP-binding protein [Gemmataceae bacterium]
MLLRTEQLTKDYGRFRALDSLDLQVAPGEIFGLLGPNGSGKSTALRLMLGFLRPTLGHAWIGEHECWSDSVAARRQVAYLPGELRLYENMTCRQLVQFLGRLRGQRDFHDLEPLARAFDIDISRPLATLSSGMKRKVALLQVLLPRTPLVILDEPTNALDPTMRDELLEQIREARRRGQAVLFSSHVLGEVEQVCDRVGILKEGKLVHVQRLADLRSAKRVHVWSDNDQITPPAKTGVVRKERELIFDYDGPLPELLAWLAGQAVRDVRIEPQGLGPIYHRYHGNEA